MSRMIKFAAVFLIAALIAGCTLRVAPSAPGQAVASENHYENGVKQYNMGHYKQAIHQFEKAIKKDPTNYKAYYYLGLSHKGEGALSMALGYLEKAFGLSSNDASWAAKIQVQINALSQEQEKNKGKGKDKNK